MSRMRKLTFAAFEARLLDRIAVDGAAIVRTDDRGPLTTAHLAGIVRAARQHVKLADPGLADVWVDGDRVSVCRDYRAGNAHLLLWFIWPAGGEITDVHHGTIDVNTLGTT